jgi:hypothetical protein
VVARELGYQLQAPGLWLDVEQFEHLCRLGQRLDTNGQRVAARAAFANAAELYAGDCLPEVWVDSAVFDCAPSPETVQLYEATLRSGRCPINPSVTRD